MGCTISTHQMAIVAPSGKHLITLIDSSGNELVTEFDVLEYVI